MNIIFIPLLGRMWIIFFVWTALHDCEEKYLTDVVRKKADNYKRMADGTATKLKTLNIKRVRLENEISGMEREVNTGRLHLTLRCQMLSKNNIKIVCSITKTLSHRNRTTVWFELCLICAAQQLLDSLALFRILSRRGNPPFRSIGQNELAGARIMILTTKFSLLNHGRLFCSHSMLKSDCFKERNIAKISKRNRETKNTNHE